MKIPRQVHSTKVTSVFFLLKWYSNAEFLAEILSH